MNICSTGTCKILEGWVRFPENSPIRMPWIWLSLYFHMLWHLQMDLETTLVEGCVYGFESIQKTASNPYLQVQQKNSQWKLWVKKTWFLQVDSVEFTARWSLGALAGICTCAQGPQATTCSLQVPAVPGGDLYSPLMLTWRWLARAGLPLSIVAYSQSVPIFC